MSFIHKVKNLQSRLWRPNVQNDWKQPFTRLREKWHEIPAGANRLTTQHLLELPDNELLDMWLRCRVQMTTEAAFDERRWYHLLYQDVLRDKKMIDVGSGLGIDGITFAQYGATVTFVDIVETNLAVLQRVCHLLNVTNVDFCFMQEVSSLSTLPKDYDVIWCQGSLHHAPTEIIREEVQELLRHLPVGGRWIQLSYPKIRWERDGKLSFDRWGQYTDGWAPWTEWYDLEKIRTIWAPAEFDVVLHFNFHNDEFNWFDLVRQK